MDIKLGQTYVNVFRLDVDERTKKETTQKIHEGIVLQNKGSFVRVYNPAPVAKGGDTAPEASELFPVKAKRMWCEVSRVWDTPITIPAMFKYC